MRLLGVWLDLIRHVWFLLLLTCFVAGGASVFFHGLRDCSIAKHEEKEVEKGDGDNVPKGALPAYLLDREGVSRAKVLSNTVKEKRKEKAGKWAVPLPKASPQPQP